MRRWGSVIGSPLGLYTKSARVICTKIFKSKVKYLYNRLKWKNHSAHAYTNIIKLGNKRSIII